MIHGKKCNVNINFWFICIEIWKLNNFHFLKPDQAFIPQGIISTRLYFHKAFIPGFISCYLVLFDTLFTFILFPGLDIHFVI